MSPALPTAINGHRTGNGTNPPQQLNTLQTRLILLVASTYACLQFESPRHQLPREPGVKRQDKLLVAAEVDKGAFTGAARRGGGLAEQVAGQAAAGEQPGRRLQEALTGAPVGVLGRLVGFRR